MFLLNVLSGSFLLLSSSMNVNANYTADTMVTFITETLNANYYTYVRPVLEQNDVLNVTIDLYLIGINNFDSQSQKLTTTAYLEVQWKDEVIEANWSSVSSEILEMYIPQNNVWLPDLALQNGFETLVGLGSKFLSVRVKKDGMVLWRPYQVFDSGCEIDVRFFPFDKTICELKFVVWSNSKDRVMLNQGSVGFNHDLYEANSEWDLKSTRVTEFTSGSVSGVLFTMELKRKPLYYLINILVPVVMLGVLNVFVFMLPAGSGEKTGFSVTAFLSFAVFLTIISAEMPRNSEKTSLFSMYLLIMTLVSTLMVVITIAQLRVFSRPEDRPISRFLTAVTNVVRRIQCAFCIGSGTVATDELKRQMAEEITWKSVSDSIDFVSFWLFLVFLIGFTVVMITVTGLGSEFLQ